MLKILLAAGILDVQVVAVFDDSLHRYSPGPLVLLPVVPPGEAYAELLKLDRLGLGVIFPSFRERLFVVPDLPGRAGTVEEEEVGGNAGIRGKNTVGETDDGMEVEILDEPLLDSTADAVTEEHPVGHNHPGPPRFRLTPEFTHNKLKEEERRLRGLHLGGEVVENPVLLFAAKGRVGEDDIHPVPVADLVQGKTKGVVRVDARIFQPVQQQVHLH